MIDAVNAYKRFQEVQAELLAQVPAIARGEAFEARAALLRESEEMGSICAASGVSPYNLSLMANQK